ncbi:hypothetical protein GQ607_003896 [Colletotrichum asianum]|uniref:Uncharacterized protein n=1 Tax=Colletotrichum asianum TaxID=702518 RepID=A0A8H3ZVR5_9PEZI|nr:hypothetical protein GQ607_003896 [Colletotrichum asianum]
MSWRKPRRLLFNISDPLTVSMEALAAISLAGNLAQFLEHALKAVSKTFKLDENLDLEEIAQDFKYGFAEKLGKLQVEIDTVKLKMRL